LLWVDDVGHRPYVAVSQVTLGGALQCLQHLGDGVLVHFHGSVTELHSDIADDENYDAAEN
jgi:hypothetical protein